MKSLLFLSIPLIMLILVTLPVLSNKSSEAEIVISAENLTLVIKGNITTLIINGYDLKSLISTINKLNDNQRYISYIVIKQQARLNNITSIIRSVTSKVNNNTYLILKNRKDIILLALALNKTLTQLNTIKAEIIVLHNNISCINSNITAIIDTLASYSYRLSGNTKDINMLKIELSKLYTKLENETLTINNLKSELDKLHHRYYLLQLLIIIALTIMAIPLIAELIIIHKMKKK